jgi:hypothetical protein
MSQKFDAFSKSKSDHCTRNCDDFQDTALDGSVDFYVPESYIMYLSDFGRFLICTCGWESGGEGGTGEGGC